MKKYFVGVIEDLLENGKTIITTDEIGRDDRLIINADWTVFVNEDELAEVKKTYELTEVESIQDWANEDSHELYHNYVEGELKHFSFTNRSEVNTMFAERLNKATKQELRDCELCELYVECAKKVIINNLRNAATQYENELTTV